jgi:hypothetical protein
MLLPGSEGTPPRVEPPPVKAGRVKAPPRVEMREIPLTTVQDTAGWAGVLDLVRARSGIGAKRIGRRMGVANWSITQYLTGDLTKRRAPRGACSVEWFVRYVEACGGRVVLHLPAVDGMEE